MKKYALPLALVSVFALQACNEKTTEAPAAVVPEAAPAGASLETTEQRLSYGIAYGLGQRMASEGVPLDTDAFAVGLADALAGDDPRLTQEEIAAEMQAYQQKAMAEQQAGQAAAGEENLVASAAYLEANAAKE